MVSLGTVAIPVFAVSLIIYIALAVRNRSLETADGSKINLLEKIAQYLSSSQSLDKTLRQIVSESPISGSTYAEVIKKIDAGQKIEQALLETADNVADDFYKKALIILANVSKKNDADMLYKSVQSLKEAAEISKTVGSKSGTGSLVVQFVFVLVIPVMYFMMSNMLGFQADYILNGFLMVLVLATALFQGVVFKQWIFSIIKVPLLLSLFYIIYYMLAPALLSGIFGSIV